MDYYDELDCYLDNIFDGFIKDNINIINISNDSIINKSNISTSIKRNDYPYLDIDKSLLYIESFFNIIDNTGNLSMVFKESINDGKILLWNESMREDIEKYYNDMFGDNRIYFINNPLYYYITDSSNTYITDSLINFPYTNTISDIIYLVHEFIHYFSLEYCNKDKKIDSDIFYLSEVISIYFETRVCDYLSFLGYDNNYLYNILESRYLDNLVDIYSTGIYFYIKLLDIKNRDGYINKDNILDNVDINLLLDKYNRNNDLFYMERDFLNNIFSSNNELDYCKILLSKLKRDNYDDNLIYRRVISYCIGTFIASENRCRDMDKKMLFVSENLTNPMFNSNILFKIIMNDNMSKKKIFKLT